MDGQRSESPRLRPGLGSGRLQEARGEGDQARSGLSRRGLIVLLGAAAALPGCGGDVAAATARDILPPTADPDAFYSACIRCFRCGEVCTAGCIEFHPPWANPALAGAPYLVPRTAGCNTCMRCTQVCPSGALSPVEPGDTAAVLERVNMGDAYVDESICLSNLGRVCGVCHDACPFPGIAIQLASHARPEVLEDCVGCGRCEERCPQLPAAIRVFRDRPSLRWKGWRDWAVSP